MEVAGSLGDLGTLLPLSIGMILLNKLCATNVFWMIGLFYIVTGLYFRLPVPVQPMKVIGAYAVSYSLTPQQIIASSLLMGGVLLLLGLTGLIRIIGKKIPKSTIRGVQLSVGVVLMIKGFKLMIETDSNLSMQALGVIPIGLLLAVLGMVLAFLLINNKKVPAALVIIGLGMVVGLFIGIRPNLSQINLGIHLPRVMPYGWPSVSDLWWVFPVLVLPQTPMTVGNAIISNTDLMHEFFGGKARRASYRSITLSQGIADCASFLMGGIPMCHGAGGLAAHYRFGARTGGSNLIIGTIFLLLALFMGESIFVALNLLPLSILGVLLVFAGLELSSMVKDLEGKKEYFVALLMLGLSLQFNLGIAFLAGIALACLLQSKRITIE
jgi:SulP family sulfate permease